MSDGREVFEKDNPFTRLAHQVAEHNRGRPMGRATFRGESVIAAEAPTLVRSAAMNAPPPIPSALDPEEQARRDKLLAEHMGVPEENIRESPHQHLLPPESRVSLTRGIPRFERVQGIDLENGVVVIDGMTFPIPEADIPDMKGYVVQVATDAISTALANALISFGLARESKENEGNGPTETNMQPMPQTNEKGQAEAVHSVREPTQAPMERKKRKYTKRVPPKNE